MLNLVLLLAAATLVSLHTASDAALLTNKIEPDNNLRPNVVSPTRARRIFRKYVKISKAPPAVMALFPEQRLQIECEVMGSPTPSVSWLKNGEPLVDYEEEANEILSVDPSSMTRVVSKLVADGAAEGDVYTCLATNNVNQRTASTTIVADDAEDTDSLLLKLMIPPTPIITFYYNYTMQELGTNVLLPCRALGKHELYWLFNEEDLIYDNARIRVLPSGDLIIKSLRWTDMGEYKCVVRNNFGTDTATAFLYPVKPGKTS